MDKKLKPVPAGNKGLPKLPKEVRNNMGFLKKGNNIAKIDSSLRYVIFIGSIIILLNCFSNLSTNKPSPILI